MKAQIKQLANCFTYSDFELTMSENHSSLVGEAKLTLKADIAVEAILCALPRVSDRDIWRLEIMSEDIELLDVNVETGNITDLINLERFAIYEGNLFMFRYTITKRSVDNRLSIYNMDAFTEFLGNKNLYNFLNIIANNHNGKLVFECVGQEGVLYHSRTIAIVSEDKEMQDLESLDYRKKRSLLCGTYCQWGTFRNKLIPEDLYFENDGNVVIVNLFKRACLLYSLMFLSDYTLIEDNKLDLKLCGFKTLLFSLNTTKMKDIAVDVDSLNRYFNIYDWCYTGGYTSERINISRNIISLNVDSTNFLLNDSTHEAIKSNFKIFEYENVKQYIDVRNKISQLLIELQGKLNSIVDGFVGDYKKNLITLVSFFISVIAIRVVSKGDFVGGFTIEVIILSYALIVISVLIFLYSKWEFEQKEKLYHKHYEQLKVRYKPLLSDEELNKAFVDNDPDIDDTHASYLKKQKKRFTYLWALTLVILTISITMIGILNNFSKLVVCPFLKLILSCFIKNT